MPQITKKALLLLWVAAWAVTVTACSSSNSKDVFSADSEEHPAGWVSSHGEKFLDDSRRCEDCHGEDLLGGIARVSCNSTSLNGLSCHPGNDSPHLTTLKNSDGSVHKDNTRLLCGKCHDLNDFQSDTKYQCQRCHADSSDSSDPLNGTLRDQYPGTFPYGFGSAPLVKTHSSAVMGTSYGTWGAECVTCHNPHEQEQNNAFGTTYGKLIKETITFTNSATGGSVQSTVRFTAASGTGSFADGTPHDENICETCHTRTNHHQADGTAPGGQSHYNGQDCTLCHRHSDGFSPKAGTPASPHNSSEFLSNCDYCHVTDGAGDPDFTVDIPDSKCNQCHTSGGALKGSFSSAPNVLSHTSDNTGTGKYSYTIECIDCHNPMSDQDNLKAVRSTIADSITSGSTITFTSLSGGGSFADGAPYDENICETCHSETVHHQADGTAPSGQSHNDGTNCTGCHGHDQAFKPTLTPPPAPHDTFDCDVCHTTNDTYVTNAAIPNSACLACHEDGTPGTSSGGSDTKVITHTSDNYTDPQTGSLASLDCVECHNPMSEPLDFRGNSNVEFIRGTVRNTSVAFESKTGQYSFADDADIPADMSTENYLCNTCHTQTNHHQADGTAPGGQSHNDGVSCISCHAHNAGFQQSGTAPPPPHNNFDCTVCHDDATTMVSGGQVPNAKCLACHDASAPGTSSGGSDTKVVTHSSDNYTDPNTGSLADLDCIECHNPMRTQTNFLGNTNRNHIRDTVRGTNVAYEDLTGQYGFADDSDIPADMSTENYICNTCHTQTNHHQNDGTATGGQSHNDGANCTGCHAHLDAFRADASSCLACHNQSPPAGSSDTNRRQIVEGTTGDGNGDFVKTSHHVTDGTTSQIVTQDDCVICHDQSNHQSFGDGVSVLLNDADGGPSYTYDGTASSAENFCLSCHDGIYTDHPFPSDINDPPNIATNWSGSAHETSGVSSCLNCHGQGHGTAYAKLLVEDNEPGLCYNCHTSGGPAPDIESEFSKTYGHPVTAASSTVQCLDCHDPHEAETGTHTAGDPTLAGVLKGVAGASPSYTSGTNWDATGTPPHSNFSYSVASTPTAEYEICFKCHSYYNTSVLSDGGSGAAAFTDVGLEFNPNNQSYHPVIQALPSSDPSGNYGSKQLTANQLTGGWAPGDTMTCSDCHGNDSGSPKGPHGSNTKWMLIGTYTAWPYTSASANGGSSGTLATLNAPGSNLFCRNCHPDTGKTGNSENKVHEKGDHKDVPCVGCHIRVPHGGKVSRMINANNGGSLPDRYFPDGNGGGTIYLEKFIRASSPTGYVKGNCYSTNGACNDHSSNISGESW